MLKFLKIIPLLIFATNGFCQETDEATERCNDPGSKIECGWHYGYIDPLGTLEVDEPEEKEQVKVVINKPDESEKCTNKDNWSEDCGFVDPGTDFEFQAMQRDIFLKNLLMKSSDPKSVENMQRYQKWLITKAVQASKVWEFNLAQKPELSASAFSPVTSFGLTMATQLRDDTTEAVISEVRNEGGIYVWFTRTDCPYCHKQTVTMKRIERNYDINIRNASLDGSCMEGFEDDCVTAPLTLEGAKQLKVDIVPSMFVYLPKDNTWIRLTNGVESISTITNRIKNFFLGVKAAHINGVENSDGIRPSVDFENDDDFRLKGIRETGYGDQRD
ncbi:conjugal transfer protein TraF [Alteromonas macleodii]|uniref:conjugal transfer protein TraF n=1 Tax=Alteromonas macleodii TaxID=28108 RepID=UPI003140862F